MVVRTSKRKSRTATTDAYVVASVLSDHRRQLGANGPLRSVECANTPPPERPFARTQNQQSVWVRLAGFADATEPSTSGGRSLLQSRPHAWPSFLRKRDPVPSPQRRDTGSAVLVCGWPDNASAFLSWRPGQSGRAAIFRNNARLLPSASGLLPIPPVAPAQTAAEQQQPQAEHAERAGFGHAGRAAAPTGCIEPQK